MTDARLRGLDDYITSGRFSQTTLSVTCANCDEKITIVATTEYGMTDWSVDTCSNCGQDLTGDEEWEEDEGPNDRHED